MSRNRKERRRADKRAFRPETPDGVRLEQKLLLSTAKHAPYAVNQYLLTHPAANNAANLKKPAPRNAHTPPVGKGPVYDKGVVVTETAHGGQSVIVAQPDGSRFRLDLTYADSQFDGGLAAETGSSTTTPATTNATSPAATSFQPQGTVRAYAMPGGQTGIIIDGSTNQMQLSIDPLPFAQRKGFAHSFAYGESGRTHVLNVGSIQVNSGEINAILGFHSANLDGPLTIGGTGVVDRIAFNSLQPGAAIGVGGTLNTLDIAQNATITAGPGISVGRDLNLLNVGQNLVISNGANFTVGRFLGVTPQPAKGTSTGSNILSLNQSQIGTGTSQLTPSVSGYIQGNLTVGPGSTFSITSGIADSSASSSGAQPSPSPLLINGQLQVISSSQIAIPNLLAATTFVTTNGTSNVVARNGILVNGVQVA